MSQQHFLHNNNHVRKPSITESHNQASRQRNSFKEIKRSKSEGSMKRSPTLMRMRSRRGRGHSRQGSAGGPSLQRVTVSKVFAEERFFTSPQVWKQVVRKVKEGPAEPLPGVQHNHWKEEETRRADIILQDLVRLFVFDQPWPWLLNNTYGYSVQTDAESTSTYSDLT